MMHPSTLYDAAKRLAGIGQDAQASGWIGGSACFCSGQCRQLGYCPNQNAINPFYQRPLPPPHDGKGYTLHTPRGREMTAGDLGLDKSDAPYAFWLGKDGSRNPLDGTRLWDNS